jgi:hypothetical protein
MDARTAKRSGKASAARGVLVGLLVLALSALSIGVALAGPPPVAVTGEATVEERDIIDRVWRDFANRFAPQHGCMGDVEVRVVARAEDWYGGGIAGPIAAFYRFPPEAVVFIEHGKVSPANLLHEFAHHMDISCGVAASLVGRAFLHAQGFAPDTDWLTGSGWARVPAENFAEAVVAVLGFETAIPIRRTALWAVRELTRTPALLGLGLPGRLGRLDPGELARAVVTESGVQLML